MLADKLDAIIDRVKQILLGLVVAAMLAVLTVLLLAPETVSDFVVGIPGFVRLLLVVVVYGGIGTLGYLRLQNVQEGRQIKGLVVKSSGGALAELSVDSAREQILKAVLKLPAVISADATVSAKRGNAVVTLSVEMKSDDQNLPDKQKEINRVLDQVVKKQLGLKMAERPTVQINLDGGGMPVVESPGESETEVLEGSESHAEKVGRRIFGGRKDDQQQDLSAEASVDAEDKDETDDSADDEPSGEFWDFLKSTASSSEANGDEVVGSTITADDGSSDKVDEPITGIADLDAPVIQDADTLDAVDDSDELSASS